MTTLDQTWLEPAIGQKIYKIKTIQVATFVGGPLVAGYLMAENYKVFNEYGKAKMAWVYSIIATIVIFGGIFLVPDSVKIPRIIIPLIYSWLTYLIVQQLQGAQIKTHFTAGGQAYTIWRALLIALIGTIITVAVIFGILYFLPVD
jgi:hypothetical protein